jgi:hypothetical protein
MGFRVLLTLLIQHYAGFVIAQVETTPATGFSVYAF